MEEKPVTTNQPLLSIAIPTWNRSKFLEVCLRQLEKEVASLGQTQNIVEILVSDNASSDKTSEIVEQIRQSGVCIEYVRNSENIGSDCNIAQCFNLARGKYVLILGDDDVLVDNALSKIVSRLKAGKYGVISFRAYGFEREFWDEYPGAGGKWFDYEDIDRFIVELGVFSTLISVNVFSKELIEPLDARVFCGTNLVQTYLIYRAALRAMRNTRSDEYLVACKRENSGGYAYSEVFVDRFGGVLDQLLTNGVGQSVIGALERRMLIGYHPFNVLRQRWSDGEDITVAYSRFKKRYSGYLSFWIFVAPILKMPRPLALGWGMLSVLVGRTINGDLRRGIYFAWNRLRRSLLMR